jgi:peptidyl-tRNA hydrolase
VQDHATADRLYLITRADLPIGLQAAQAAHAAFEFSHQHRIITSGWMRESNFIVLVTVPDESTLSLLAQRAVAEGIRVSLNFEVDLDDSLTAIVLEPGPVAKRLCQKMPLLGAVMT